MKNFTALALLWLLALVPALAQSSETRSLPSFQAVEVSSGIELHLVAGQPQMVQASADTPELLARIKTEVSGGVLKITFNHKLNEAWSKNNRPRNLQVNVTAAALNAIKASSGSKVDVASPYAVNKLDLEISSGATLQGNFTAADLKASVSSGGVATIAGKIQRLDVQASSGAVFKGSDLQATACDASASSGGTVTVAVQDKLTANASSGGDVRYLGSPQAITKHTSSGGSVKSR